MNGIADWAAETMVWTAALLALVLLIRRPVAQVFGPRVAYALWLLPILRLVLPPFELPARLAPQVMPDHAGPVAVAASGIEPAMVGEATAIGAPLAPPEALLQAGTAAWLIGAVVFLAWRWHAYGRMRDTLLAGARPVGHHGRIRLVETGAVDAPVAFGLRDRVIAMPPEFMASPDVRARDLAIAHEIAHHRGGDLVANVAAQPLLALHWFNPLAFVAWRAMRRDQEAACDARVAEGFDRETRALYGAAIATVARERNLALAAPMAGLREIGPRLGEKAIVHRLRSLNNATSRRRQRAGALLVAGTALVALPMTASYSYAEPERFDAEAPAAVETVAVPASSAEVPSDWAQIDDNWMAPVPAIPDVPDVPDASGRPGSSAPSETGYRVPPTPPEPPRVGASLPAPPLPPGAARESAEREMRVARREMEQAERQMRRDHAQARRDHAQARRDKAEARRTLKKVREIEVSSEPSVVTTVSADGRTRTVSSTSTRSVYKTHKPGTVVLDASCIAGTRVGKGKDAPQRICTGSPDTRPMVIRAIVGAREAIAGDPNLGEDIRVEILQGLDEAIREVSED